jgi:hypothetical protein
MEFAWPSCRLGRGDKRRRLRGEITNTEVGNIRIETEAAYQRRKTKLAQKPKPKLCPPLLASSRLGLLTAKTKPRSEYRNAVVCPRRQFRPNVYAFSRFQFTSSPIVDPVLDAGCLYASTSVREASSPAARMLSPTFFSSGLILMILKSCSLPGSR